LVGSLFGQSVSKFVDHLRKYQLPEGQSVTQYHVILLWRVSLKLVRCSYQHAGWPYTLVDRSYPPELCNKHGVPFQQTSLPPPIPSVTPGPAYWPSSSVKETTTGR